MHKKRLIAVLMAILFMLAGVDTRIGFLTLGGKSEKTEASHGSYSLKINTGRGTIYDSNLSPIVNGSIKYVAAVMPQTDAAEQLRKLAPHVKDMSALQTGFAKRKPFTIEVDSPNIQAEGINIFMTKVRYGQKTSAAHIIGYTNSDGGVAGIEKAYDSVLKKYSGSVTLTYAVDAKGRGLAGVEEKTEMTGNTDGGVVLTIDSNIQKAAQTAADKYLKTGCVIVMDIKTGDILASVSKPDYSPLDVSKALKAEDSPLINRAFTAYNLGSAFKISVACAALESNIDKAEAYNCSGAVNVSGRDFHCEKLSGHGKEDMALGFANSCNTYFITLGLKTGGEKLLDMAKCLGFGRETVLAPGIVSDAGTIPTQKQLSVPAAVANFSIGQGVLMATPLQVACMVSTVANGGKLPTARLVKGIYDGKTMVEQYPSQRPRQVISPEVASTVSGFMIKTVNEGTGMPAKPTYGGAGGKTATAETGWVKNGKAINQAWFAGFYPAQSPRYAIVAMFENGKAGGADAGPVFKYIADSLAPSCGFTKKADSLSQ